MAEQESPLEALRERMDRVGPPWGNKSLLASRVEDGYVAGYLALAIAEAYSRFDDIIGAVADARREDYQELQRLLAMVEEDDGYH